MRREGRGPKVMYYGPTSERITLEAEGCDAEEALDRLQRLLIEFKEQEERDHQRQP